MATEVLYRQIQASPMATDTKAILVRTGECRPLYQWPPFSALGGSAPKPAAADFATPRRGMGCLGVVVLTGITALIFLPAAPFVFAVLVVAWLVWG